MELLILSFVLSIGISFICSLVEIVFTSVTKPYIGVLKKEQPKIGTLLEKQKENFSKSVASILILNTIANTAGAAVVGAQAAEVFGSDAVAYISAVLTLAILVLAEIIPKTIAGIFWKELAPLAARLIRIFTIITYPIIIMTEVITAKISKNEGEEDSKTKARAEFLENALIGEAEGVIDEKESDVIENILRLDDIKVSEVLTPRSVVFALDEEMRVKDVIANQPAIFKFSRIPVYRNSIEDVTGLILTKRLFKQALEDDTVELKSIKKDIFAINENIPVSKALDLFISKKEHMFLVRDNYDQTEGIVTLEDCVETILGVEIMDESDTTEDMRELAKRKMKLKRKLKGDAS